ncbi:Alpha/beta hydrolase fold-1 [Macleaya cordata]|uniref:soluble epoxide hydrolase n=1 Tax=Macleaya cordata TaxID=56857 RepID=A0A200QSK8_MACCD|nr:Alpha/beta hydrolase fold-1 [Macleaya cordata]
MENIEHKMVAVNGINMHIAEKGEGPVVLLVHGFPELWYTWKHQIVGLASLGYRAVAPDLRGYGDTDAPPSSNTYTTLHVAGDLIALLDALGLDQVFVVGHDWGANIAWSLCLYRPDRVKALVNLSIAFVPRNPSNKPTERLRAAYGDEYYMIRFQEPGKMEAEFAEAGASTVVKKFLTLRDPGPLIIPKETWLKVSPDNPNTLPSWLSEDDVNYFASKFEEKGFTGGLNYYRAFDLNWELTAAWTGTQVKVPVKFIVGDLDLTLSLPGIKEYIHGGEFKKDVPLLEEVVVMEGAAHYINQEKSDEISKHIYDFIKKF